MRKQAIALMVFMAFLSILVGCSEKTPPIPKVISEKTQIPVTQSSYCWGKLGCADYAGGKTMLKGKNPTVVVPESNIKVSFDYKPAPTQIAVQQFQDEKIVDVPLTDGYFKAPKEKGAYYYGLSAYWTTDDRQYSKGSTSSVFIIEVR
ncbi:hypothetical protein ACFC0X_15885 [Paenibacillus chitinolyticus]|uniref:hypothetical protein n=1 Tax=Paenibacillus chitinolyticus TaxID=79263 RepID=UPI0035E302A3